MNPDQHAELVRRYQACPPIVRAAIDALLVFEESVDEMGYDLSYYQDDLPATVSAAIKPWRQFDGAENPGTVNRKEAGTKEA